MRECRGDAFPVEELEAAMARQGKSLRSTDAEIEALSWTEYGKNAFSVLAALYPGWDGSRIFHVDHIFPRKRLTKASLLTAGVGEADAAAAAGLRDHLPNLQLLEGAVNTSKQATMPLEWMAEHLPDELSRQAYLAGHDLAGLPADLDGFLGFFEARRKRIVSRLRTSLGTAGVGSREDVDGAPAPDDELALS